MLKVLNFGQNVGTFGPNLVLTGDPSVDNTSLTTAGYLGGKVVALTVSTNPALGTVLVMADSAVGNPEPVGFLMNGPGEFAGAIGPSGSGLISFVRAFPEFYVDSQAYVATPVAPYTVGQPVYVGTGATAGLITADKPTAGYTQPIGTLIALPNPAFPYLQILSLL